MQRLIRISLSRHIVVNALKIGLVVGTLLNLVNQGAVVLQGATIEWGHVILNYIVPYCVASYSAARNELELMESNDCQPKE